MSSEAWDAIEPRIDGALGGSACESGFTQSLASSHAELVGAIEDYARSNGPTDDLLAALAPAAKGDLVMVLTVAGKLPPKNEVASLDSTSFSSSTGGAGASPGPPRRGGGRTGSSARGPVSTDELDLSASLFSVAASKSVAQISMRYVGASLDEAMAQFAAKIAEGLPQARCAGWTWDVPIDAARIRNGADP